MIVAALNKIMIRSGITLNLFMMVFKNLMPRASETNMDAHAAK